jgi:hypothetical protein
MAFCGLRTLFRLEANAIKAAQGEGLSSVKIAASKVTTGSDLAELLEKKGYKGTKVTDRFGHSYMNYTKTISAVPQ